MQPDRVNPIGQRAMRTHRACELALALVAHWRFSVERALVVIGASELQTFDVEFMDVIVLPVEGLLDHAMQLRERQIFRHGDPPPNTRMDVA